MPIFFLSMILPSSTVLLLLFIPRSVSVSKGPAPMGWKRSASVVGFTAFLSVLAKQSLNK